MGHPLALTSVPRVFRSRPLVPPTDAERLAAAHRVRALHLAGFFFGTASVSMRAVYAIGLQLDRDDTVADRSLILAAAESFGPRGQWPASVEHTATWYELRPGIAVRADAYGRPQPDPASCRMTFSG